MKESIGILLMVISAFAGSIGALYLKKASDFISFDIIKIIKNRPLFVGILFYGFGTMIAIPAYRFAEVSLLYPFIATSYVWTCILSWRYLKERMNIWKWSGIFLIMVGVTFIGIGY
ncbi:MAG: EamA family transporter [Nanoarchaeota archaeon]|nr:EamA family transporter [Nanoarchaeota archaeon]